MAKTRRTKSGRVIAVLNMKGGVGKTTIAGNLFREAFRSRGLRTLLVDFDAQFNLTQLLLTRQSYEQLKSNGKTVGYVMDPAISESAYHTSTADTIDIGDVDDFTYKIRHLSGRPKIELRLLPGDFRLAMLNLRESASALKTARNRFRDMIEKAKSRYDIVVLDCNPSSSFLTRCALESATDLLIPIKPDKYSILGVELLTDYISQMPSIRSNLTQSIVINDATSTPQARRIISEIRGHTNFGPNVLVHVIPRSNVLLARSDYSGFAVDRGVAWTQWLAWRLSAVANEYIDKIGATR